MFARIRDTTVWAVGRVFRCSVIAVVCEAEIRLIDKHFDVHRLLRRRFHLIERGHVFNSCMSIAINLRERFWRGDGAVPKGSVNVNARGSLRSKPGVRFARWISLIRQPKDCWRIFGMVGCGSCDLLFDMLA